jgi:hypothetical protein
MMMFSNERVPAVSVYPDSDKIGVWPGDEANVLIFKRTTAVPYSDGEEDGRTPAASRGADDLRRGRSRQR